MASTPVVEISRRIGEQLKAEGLHSAVDVAQMNPAMVRRRWGSVLERTVRELCDFAYIELEDEPPPKKEIACTQSFGYPFRPLRDLGKAVTELTSLAAEKLRLQGCHACRILVFIHTSPFRHDQLQYSKAISVPLRLRTSDIAQLVRAALHGLRAIYREGINYAKARVHLREIEPANVEQKELPLNAAPPSSARLRRYCGVRTVRCRVTLCTASRE